MYSVSVSVEMTPSDCVKVQWVGEPIPNPGRAGVRPFGGRFTHYDALEIVYPAAAATTIANAVSISANDIVEVACKRGVTNDGIESSDQPFLAQVSERGRERKPNETNPDPTGWAKSFTNYLETPCE